MPELKYLKYIEEKDRPNRNYNGIYKITFKNSKSGKCYVGSALSKHNKNKTGGFYTRVCSHVQSYIKGYNGCTKLVDAINHYGIENLVMSILEIIPLSLGVDFCLDRETYYINKFDSYHSGYNSTIISNSSFGVKRSKEFNDNLAKYKFRKLYRYSLDGEYVGLIESKSDLKKLSITSLNKNKLQNFYYSGRLFTSIFVENFLGDTVDLCDMCRFVSYNKDGTFYKAFFNTKHIGIHFNLPDNYNFGNLYNFKTGKIFLNLIWKRYKNIGILKKTEPKVYNYDNHRVYCYSILNGVSSEFESCRKCATTLNVSYKLISKSLNTGNNYTSGYIFSYKELTPDYIKLAVNNLISNKFILGRIKSSSNEIYLKLNEISHTDYFFEFEKG